ncbi:MAG: YlmC/YmxH family sporulation protein [Bacillota bacterium]|jgi:YlmC/YmxH family sporulation protein
MEYMRFSDIASKELIDYNTGRCLGAFADCDLRIDPATGKILEVILAGRGGLVSLFFSATPVQVIPWSSIIRIGIDTIIVGGEKG